jgi:hypothetical protein
MGRAFVQCTIYEFILSENKMGLIILVTLTAKLTKGKVVYLGEGHLLFRMSLRSASLVWGVRMARIDSLQ